MLRASLIASTAMAVCLTATQASAEVPRWPHWYVGLSGSVNFLMDSDVDLAGVNEYSFDTGWGVNGALGYRPGYEGGGVLNHMRFELELGYRENDTKEVQTGGGTFDSFGDVSSTSYMVNAFYDMDTQTPWTPYVGVGVGLSEFELETNSPGASLAVDDSDMVFSYQFMAGVAYAPKSFPMTEVLVGYRYFGSEDPELTVGSTEIEVEQNSHNLEAGFRFHF